MSRKQIVILGGGTGGTMTANRLRRRFDADEADIHVVDGDDRHVYQPGLLFVPFGLADLDEIVRPRRRQLRGQIVFHETGEVEGNYGTGRDGGFSGKYQSGTDFKTIITTWDPSQMLPKAYRDTREMPVKIEGLGYE